MTDQNASNEFVKSTPLKTVEFFLTKLLFKILIRTIMRTRCTVTMLLVVVLMMISCKENPTNPSLEDLAGVWQLSTTVISNTCGLIDGSTSTETITLIQCGTEVSVISGAGLWGRGTVQDDHLEFTGTEVKTDDEGCVSTHYSTGTLTGTSTLLEGTFTTSITFDNDSCGDKTDCSVETSASLSLIAAYRSSCIDRDDFGDPAASEYILPWLVGKSYVLTNSYCQPNGGHREQLAYDFAIPIGDTVVAAREGVVRQVKENSPDDGQGSDHNHVMIEHTDGTVGFYAHLKQWGVLVEVGENVDAGQTIALAGHSGTTDIVHLHFGVYGSWPPTEGNDRAVNFRNTDGPVDCRGGLVVGETYEAISN